MSRWYIGTDTGSKALAHYAKGASAKDHKWVSRSLKNGHWVYVYNDSKSGDSDSSNLDRVKNQTEQRKSMNAQAENERNKALEREADYRERYVNSEAKFHGRLNSGEPMSDDEYRKYKKGINSLGIEFRPGTGNNYDDDLKNRTEAIAAQYRYGQVAQNSRSKILREENDEAKRYITKLQDLSLKYKKAGYKFAKNTPWNQLGTSPDTRLVMTNPKTGKTIQLPTARELMKSEKKQEAILRKNEIGPYKTIGTLAKERADANNKASAANAQQRYAELTKSLPKQKTTPSAKTPSAKSHEVNSNGFKARPATAADADLFKNKSSAETKNKVTISDHGGNTGIKTEVIKKKKKRL